MPLTIVGPQPDRETAAALVPRWRMGRNVTSRKASTTSSSCGSTGEPRCIVLPSVYRTSIGTETAVPELLGQTLLEGMACETPAICTNVASLPEVVEDGVTGFVVPPNDPAALGDRLETVSSRPGTCQSRWGRPRGRACSNDLRGTAWCSDVSRPTKDGARWPCDDRRVDLDDATPDRSEGRGSCSIA